MCYLGVLASAIVIVCGSIGLGILSLQGYKEITPQGKSIQVATTTIMVWNRQDFGLCSIARPRLLGTNSPHGFDSAICFEVKRKGLVLMYDTQSIHCGHGFLGS